MKPDVQLDNLRVVLVSTRNPLNIGAAARAMSNFGIAHLRVVNPFEPSFREARSAVHAAELLQRAEAFSTVPLAVSDCSLVVGTTAGRDRELQHPMHPLAQAAPLIREHLAHGRVAMLFGSEKRGLSNDDLSHCHWLLHIPTQAQHLSMNLGQAVAVCLYKLAHAHATTPNASKKRPAQSADLERLTEVLLDALQASGYFKGEGADLAETKLRRLVHRLELSAEDAELVLGMMRKITWKLHAEK